MQQRNLFTAAALVVATTWAIACADDNKGTGPETPTPTRISLSHTVVNLNDGQSTGVRATVYDQNDQPMPDQEVTWTSADPSIATVDKGTVTAQRPGTTEITASAGTASAKAVVNVAPVAATLQRAGGDQQKGLPGAPLADSLVVRVADRHGIGVPGVQVSFVVTAGGGSVSPAAVMTDAEGYATAEWVLGAATLIQKVKAHVDEFPDILPIEFAATAVVNEPATVAVGDTILGMIGMPGEIDTFGFAGTEGQTLMIFFQPQNSTGNIFVEFFEHYGTPSQRRLSTYSTPQTTDPAWRHTSWFTLPADGTYTIVVSGDMGAYSFYVYEIDLRPESIESPVAIGDTIEGESISPAGDIDEFTFAGVEGQEIVIFFQPLNGTHEFNLFLTEHKASGGLELIEGIRASVSTDLWEHNTRRIRLSGDATYTVRIMGNPVGSVGAYRFLVFPIDFRPESIPSTFAIGDTVEGESISPKGDVDVFTFVGTEGQEVDILIQRLSGRGGLMLRLFERFNSLNDFGFTWVSIPEQEAPNPTTNWYESGRFRLPADGTYTAVVYATTWSGHGSYRFVVAPTDRRPEALPSMVAIGDTIEGETIDPIGDVDEFTFIGSKGQVVDVYLQPLVCCTQFILEVYDQYGTPEETKLGEIATIASDDLERFGILGLTLPRDGVYTVVVSGSWGAEVVGPYRFHIRTRD